MGTPAEPTSPTGEITGSSEAPGINPAWNDVLSVLPEQYHAVVTPHFQKWDNEAQNKITELNSQVGSWKDFQFLQEHGFTSEQVTQALNIMQELNTNPKNIYDALEEAYKFSGANSPVATGENPSEVNPWESKYNELQGQLSTISQIMLQQEEARNNARADAQVDAEINAALQKFPDVVLDKNTENYILTQAYTTGMSIEQAFQQFVDFRNALSPQPYAPQVMGSTGGGVPSQAIDPKSLSGKDTRNLVVQMLMAGKAANNPNT